MAARAFEALWRPGSGTARRQNFRSPYSTSIVTRPRSVERSPARQVCPFAKPYVSTSHAAERVAAGVFLSSPFTMSVPSGGIWAANARNASMIASRSA